MILILLSALIRTWIFTYEGWLVFFPQIPSLQCVTCHNMVSTVIHSFLKQPIFLPDCLRTFMIQWGPFCQSCGEPFPALLIKDILSQNVERKGCERLDGIEDRVGDRDGRDEGGGQDRSDVEKQQVTLICC